MEKQRKTKQFKFVAGVILLLLACSSCEDSHVYEKNRTISKHSWDRFDTLIYQVEINDTNATYDLLFNIRHTFDYPKTNLWVALQRVAPSGTTIETPIMIELGDNKKEQWNGSCIGDICDLQTLLTNKYNNEGIRFEEKGKYTYRLRHTMRTNPLEGMMDFGIRLERRH